MGKILKLADDTYQRLMELARRQHRTPEEIIRALLLDYENAKYRQVNQQMLAQATLTSVPTAQSMQVNDFEPESIPGKPLSEIIIEERR
jgi:predicted transcriptional regulator